MPTLVSMAPSGETFITYDDRHGFWLHLPPGAGGAGPITEAASTRAVSHHGFVSLNQEFATWRELEHFRQNEAAQWAPPVIVDPIEFDRDDVEELLNVARRWAAQGDGPRARRLAIQLLRAPVLLEHQVLHAGVTSVLERLDEVTLSLHHHVGAPADGMKAEAHRRWRDLELAAA